MYGERTLIGIDSDGCNAGTVAAEKVSSGSQSQFSVSRIRLSVPWFADSTTWLPHVLGIGVHAEGWLERGMSIEEGVL